MKGLFLSFEGVDGCGKSRQMQFASEYLKEKGFDPLLTREPGGCRIAEQIRAILLDPDNTEMNPYTEALLYAAARSQHVDEVIRPAVEAGRIVMTDRFLDSSLAYQGFGRRLGVDDVLDINRFAVRGVLPDATIFLDVPPDTAFERMNDRTSYDRMEESGGKFFDTLYNGFLSLCERYPERIIRIDASGSKDETREKVRAVLDNILFQSGTPAAECGMASCPQEIPSAASSPLPHGAAAGAPDGRPDLNGNSSRSLLKPGNSCNQLPKEERV